MAALRGIARIGARAARHRGSLTPRLAAGLRPSATSAALPPRRRLTLEGLADPKDKVDLFNLMTHAQELSRHRGQAGSNAEVGAVLRQVSLAIGASSTPG